MARFPNLELEKTLQVNDKTRLSATKSFVSTGEGAITDIEIDPGTGVYVSVYSAGVQANWYLDYQYTSAGTRTINCRLTTGAGNTIISGSLPVVTVASDYLFSNDQDIAAHESDILKYVRPGRNSFKDIHRRAQELILAWLDEQGYVDADGNRLTKASLVDIEEVRQWSTFQCLELICFDQSNAIDDIWDRKSKAYAERKVQAQNRSILRFDRNNDGSIDDGENFSVSSSNAVRR